jgi:hypothetical protein
VNVISSSKVTINMQPLIFFTVRKIISNAENGTVSENNDPLNTSHVSK